MYRLLCLCLAVGIASAYIETQSRTYELDETVDISCGDKSPLIDSAYFYLSEAGYDNTGCDYYMDLDLRAEVAKHCEDQGAACSFVIDDVIGKEPDSDCVGSFLVSYGC